MMSHDDTCLHTILRRRTRPPGLAGCPPVLSALSLAYNGNLFGGITHFASGQAAIFYGSGFNSLSEFFVYGAIFGFLSLVITLGVGWPWWQFLGWM